MLMVINGVKKPEKTPIIVSHLQYLAFLLWVNQSCMIFVDLMTDNHTQKKTTAALN